MIQVNHPRWTGIDYFAQADLDPVTGESTSPIWSYDFDSIEILNENGSWGFENAETHPGHLGTTGANRHWVLGDWFHLLNRGRRYAAVGNSDSHHVHQVLAGYPRNFVQSPTDNPEKIDPKDIAQAVRGLGLFTTVGPFVRWSIDGKTMGGLASAQGGEVKLRIKIEAASWIDVDLLKIVVNGDVAQRISLPWRMNTVRFDAEIPIRVPVDSWVCLLVEGDEPLAIVAHATERPVLPFAVTNPI